MKVLIILAVAACLAVSMAWAEEDALEIDDGSNRVRQEYNGFTGEWETVQGEKELTFNPHENTWSYESPGAQPTYNPHSDTWEYPR